jgi:hypothetical protein
VRRTPAEIAAEERQPASRQQSTLAKVLAWFSVGLGAAEAAVPGLMTRVIGVRNDVDNREVVRAAGMREIASGVGLLAQPQRRRRGSGRASRATGSTSRCSASWRPAETGAARAPPSRSGTCSP